MSQVPFNEAATDPFLPQIGDDPSLDSLLRCLNDTGTNASDIASTDTLDFLSNTPTFSSRDVELDNFFNADTPSDQFSSVHSDYGNSPPQHVVPSAHHNVCSSSTSSRASTPQPFPYYDEPAAPIPLASGYHSVPPTPKLRPQAHPKHSQGIHHRSYSQPPEPVQFFHTMPIDGRHMHSKAHRIAHLPPGYMRSRSEGPRRQVGDPTSVPVLVQSTASPLARAVHSPRVVPGKNGMSKGNMSSMLRSMDTRETKGRSKRFIEIGAAAVLRGAGGLNMDQQREDRPSESTALGMLDEVERKLRDGLKNLREGLQVCDALRSMVKAQDKDKDNVDEEDIEPLQLSPVKDSVEENDDDLFGTDSPLAIEDLPDSDTMMTEDEHQSQNTFELVCG